MSTILNPGRASDAFNYLTDLSDPVNGSSRGTLTGTHQSRQDDIHFGSRHPSICTDHDAQTRPGPPFRPFAGMRRSVNRETCRNQLHGVDIPRSDRDHTATRPQGPTRPGPGGPGGWGYTNVHSVILFFWKNKQIYQYPCDRIIINIWSKYGRLLDFEALRRYDMYVAPSRQFVQHHALYMHVPVVTCLLGTTPMQCSVQCS